MDKKYPVIALIGNLEVKDEVEDVEEDLTLRGYIVLAPFIFPEVGFKLSESQEVDINLMTKQRIYMADEVLVINSNGYLTTTTNSSIIDHIRYANSLNKKVNYLYYKCEQSTCKYKGKCEYDECPIYYKKVVARLLDRDNLPFDTPKCEYYEKIQ